MKLSEITLQSCFCANVMKHSVHIFKTSKWHYLQIANASTFQSTQSRHQVKLSHIYFGNISVEFFYVSNRIVMPMFWEHLLPFTQQNEIVAEYWCHNVISEQFCHVATFSNSLADQGNVLSSTYRTAIVIIIITYNLFVRSRFFLSQG